MSKKEKLESNTLDTLDVVNTIKIQNILKKEFGYIYCHNCAFQNITEKEAEKAYGYYGCDSCHRKNIGWEISESTSEKLAEGILKTLQRRD